MGQRSVCNGSIFHLMGWRSNVIYYAGGHSLSRVGPEKIVSKKF